MLKNKTILAGLLLTLLLSLVFTGSAAAAQFEGATRFHLEADEVIEDDLYIAGETIIIDGTVVGDVFVGGTTIEINGTITGDLFAAGSGIIIKGTVEDDVRIAAGGVEIDGSIGDDLFVAAGGGAPFAAGPQPVPQGLFLSSNSTIGGDAFIGGGEGQIAGDIDGSVDVTMGSATFGARVGGNATIEATDLTFTDSTQIGGKLEYPAIHEQDLPPGTASDITLIEAVDEGPSATQLIVNWIIRTAAIIAGFGILAWLVLRYAPQLVKEPAAVVNENIGSTLLWGFVGTIGFMFIPIASALLVGLVAVFWGGFPAFVLFLALFSVLALLWIFSPLITGYWVGSQLSGENNELVSVVLGIAILVLLTRIPLIGWLVSLGSFVIALGAIILSQRGGNQKMVEKTPDMLV